MVYWSAPHEDIFFCVASWLFRIMGYSFTECLSWEKSLLRFLFVIELLSIATVYIQLKIKYHQDKFNAFFRHIQHDKDTMSFPLEDKHAVNEHHTIQKNHDATQKKCPHIVHIFNVLHDWFKTDSTSKTLLCVLRRQFRNSITRE